MLDPGDATRRPLLFPWNSREVCYQALPATPEGKYAPPQGAKVPAGLADDDPRWTRSLPWTTVPDALTDPKSILAVAGLALLNVVIPLAILRLAARQRRWTVRVLMALPVAAAIPLMALNYLEPMLADRTDPLGLSPKIQFILGTLAGIPIVAFAVLALLALIRRRWQALATLAVMSLLASLIIAAAWIWHDMKSMPSIEHYGRAGWYLILLPGAYAAGAIMPILLAAKRIVRRHPPPERFS